MNNKYLEKIAQTSTEEKPFRTALATAAKAKAAELPAQFAGGAAGAYLGTKLIKAPIKFPIAGKVAGGVLGAFAGQEIAGFGGSLASIYRDTKNQQRHQDV